MELVIDSTYKPLSFQELIQPFVEYKKDYEKIEEDYSNLVAQTETWRNIANREKSPEAFEMFSRYANQLNAIADDFSQGMNPRNRSQLLAMKRGYASNILPIAQAAEAMKQANALRDEKGPDAIFEEGRYDSIDRFLNGQVPNNKYESRKDIAARTAALTQAAAQSIQHDPEIKQALGEYGNQFLEVIQKTGLGGLAELESAIRGDAAAENAFAKVKQQMLTEIGGLDRFDFVGRQAIEQAINEGLYAGLTNYHTSLQQNGEYMTKAQRHSMAMQSDQLALSAANDGMVKDANGNWVYDSSKDPAISRATARKGSGPGSGKGGSDSGTERANRLKGTIKVRATNKGGGSGDYAVGATWDLEGVPEGATNKAYGELTSEQKEVVDRAIGADSREGYEYYVITEDASGLGTGDDDLVIIRPKNTVINGSENIDTDAY